MDSRVRTRRLNENMGWDDVNKHIVGNVATSENENSHQTKY